MKQTECSNPSVMSTRVGLPHLLSSADLLKPTQVYILSIKIDDMLFPGLPACGCRLHLQIRHVDAVQDSPGIM